MAIEQNKIEKKKEIKPKAKAKVKKKTSKYHTPKPTKEGFSSYSRQRAIETCTKCNGQPELLLFNLDGMEGERCSDGTCMKVANWKKI